MGVVQNLIAGLAALVFSFFGIYAASPSSPFFGLQEPTKFMVFLAVLVFSWGVCFLVVRMWMMGFSKGKKW